MRVVHLCQRDDPSVGGANEVARALVPRLVQRGVDARVLFVYGPRGALCAQLGERADSLELRDGRDVWKGAPLLRARLAQLCPDVLHQHDGLPWTTLAASWCRSYRRLWHAHLDASTRNAKEWIALAVNKRTLDGVLCVSELTRESFLRAGFGASRLSLISNGVDLDRFRPPAASDRWAAKKALGLPPESSVVGFVGRLHCATKGVDDVIRGLAALPQSHRLVVVGDGPDSRSLRALAKSFGVDARVRWTGAVSDVAPCYRAMDTFAFASHFETFGLVVLEALASGLPVVAFPMAQRVNLLGRLPTGAIHFLSDREPSHWAAAVLKACSDPRSQVQARLASAAYDWGDSVDSLCDAYQSLWSKPLIDRLTMPTTWRP